MTLAFIALAFFLAMAVAILVARRPKPKSRTWRIEKHGAHFQIVDPSGIRILALWNNLNDALQHAFDVASVGDVIEIPPGIYEWSNCVVASKGVNIVGGK
jgi:hypothetical protein